MGRRGGFRKEAELLVGVFSRAAYSMPGDGFYFANDFPTSAQVNIRAC